MIKNILILGFISLYLKTVAQNYDTVLICQKTNIEINNENLAKDFYYLHMIFNRAVEKYTKIEIPFSKLIKVSNLEAYIKDSKDKIVNERFSNF